MNGHSVKLTDSKVRTTSAEGGLIESSQYTIISTNLKVRTKLI